MPKIPLILKLKKKMHKDIAEAQDIITKELYKVFDRAVIHGGTSIWRCYGGNRFSEDIDAYIARDQKRIESLFENFKRRGFTIHKKKMTENSLYSSLELDGVIVRFEALFKKPLPKGILQEYETSDGNLITVYTLSPEDLIKEKVEAYLKRLKIRDLYDVFFLLRYVKDKKEVLQDLKRLLKQFKRPVDERELKVLVVEGITPSTEDMLAYIERGI